MEPDLDDTVSGDRAPVVPKKRTLADLDDDTLFSKLRGGGLPLQAEPPADVEDTVARAPKETTAPRVGDPEGGGLDDTVARGSARPPELVEPPRPEARPLPLVDSLTDLFPAHAEDVEAAPVRLGQPPLRVQLPDGTVVPLDGAVYVGRKPSAPRIHVGPAPRLVTLPSPAHELSATHLELRIVGGALVASDMRSTNGTVVRLPGAAPRTLIRGESQVVVPGTRIDLGDGAVLDILEAAEVAS